MIAAPRSQSYEALCVLLSKISLTFSSKQDDILIWFSGWCCLYELAYTIISRADSVGILQSHMTNVDSHKTSKLVDLSASRIYARG